MKKLIIGFSAIIITLTAIPILAQPLEYHGIDVTQEPESSNLEAIADGFYTYIGDYKKGYFDDLLLKRENEQLNYLFVVNKPTMMKYDRILDELIERFGSEDSNDDYIPAALKQQDDSIKESMLPIYIRQGKAEINKIWKPTEESTFSLQWNSDLLAVVVLN